MVIPTSQPPIAAVPVRISQLPESNVVSLARVENDVRAIPRKQQFKAVILRKAKFHNPGIRKSAKPVMTAKQNIFFRLSWFDRMASK